MIDKDKIRDKVIFIRKQSRMLSGLSSLPETSFNDESIQFHAAVRMLQVAIEAMIDIGSHIVAREGIGTPKTYVEVFELLEKADIIPMDLLEKAKSMVRFRNRAVHLYGDIDEKQIYSIIKSDLGDFDTFLKLILERYF